MTATRAALALLALAVCQARSRQDVSALITHPTAESHAELVRVVSEALNGAALTIAEDALTRESTLIIERVRPRDAEGALLSGRESGRPEHFRLVMNDSRCVLVHERTRRRWTLRSATCAPR